MFKLGDIIVRNPCPLFIRGQLLVEAIDKYLYKARYITGSLDGRSIYIFIGELSHKNYKKVCNIFEKGGGGQ